MIRSSVARSMSWPSMARVSPPLRLGQQQQQQRTAWQSQESKRCYGTSTRRAPNFATVAAIGISVALTAYTSQTASLQLDAAPISHKSASLTPPNVEDYHIDPATQQRLPKRLKVPAAMLNGPSISDSEEPYMLLASGVRTVSFLRVQVYVAALYVHEASYNNFLQQRSTGESSSSSSTSGNTSTPEAFMRSCLEAGVPAVLKIVPVRNTDFSHLRDGFTRAVQLRMKYLRKAGEGQEPPSPEQEEAIAMATQKLKDCFPKAALKKGDHLDLVLRKSQASATGVAVSLEHDGTVLGTVDHDPKGKELDVGKLLLQAYVADKEPVSEVFKNAVVQAIATL